MFGFGRKKGATAPAISSEIALMRLQTLRELHGKYPGTIPGSGVKVADVGLELAKKVKDHFSLNCFEKIFIPIFHIERGFPSGWSRADALSRWYALGLICLTHCSLTSIWNEALTLEVGNQVYDATVEEVWAFWSMPDVVRENVMLFMGSNIKSITSSLRTIVDERSEKLWFLRYSERLVKGGVSPWDISFGGQSDNWRDKFPEARFC